MPMEDTVTVSPVAMSLDVAVGAELTVLVCGASVNSGDGHDIPSPGPDGCLEGPVAALAAGE